MNPAVIDARATGVGTADVGSTDWSLRPLKAAPSAAWAWWLWPHLLSLDAPIVALAWQRWWAHTTDIALPASREVILGLGVWLIYLADRLADNADDRRQGEWTSRHRFSGRFRSVLLPTVCCVAAALTILTPCTLPGVEFRAGLCLLVLALGYFWLIHCWPGRGWAAYLPKEAVVGAMFSVGTVFFVVCRTPHLPATFWVGSVLFAAVCFLNCALITSWEGHVHDLYEQSSLLNAFPRFSSRLRGACVLLALASLATSALTMSWFVVPVAVSALLLAGLNWFAPRMRLDALRVLADVALLTPLFGWIYATAAA